MASKSLGTLTLDLVAKTGGFVQGMDKASRKSQKTAKQIERYSNQIGAALTAASAAAVTGIAAMVVSTSTGAREVQNLARLAGATPQEFQKAAYGAKRYGIEQEKLSDILKDTNDRIGDFIQTGGGPMADFFENIAPKVGVTAEQFAKLSGPDALQLYVKSLKDAGVSQKDMTFYMEAIASDATALLPLLRDNGKEMKILGDEAERTGNVFSDLEFEQLEDVKRGLDELTGAATGMKNEVVMAALPAINDLIDLLSDESTMKSAQALGTAVVTAMNKAAQAIDGTIKITQFLAEELAAMTAGAAADDIVRLEDELGTLYSMLDNPTNRVRFFGKDGAVVYYNKDEIWDMIAETENKIVNFRNNIGKGSRPAPLLDLVSPPTAPDVDGGSGGTDTSGGGVQTGFGRDGLEEDLAKRLETLTTHFETEKQTILRAYGERDEEITELREAETISKMAADNFRFENEKEKMEAMSELRNEAAEKEKERMQSLVDAEERAAKKREDVERSAQAAIGSLRSSTVQAGIGLLNVYSGEHKAAALASIAITKGIAIAQTLAHTQTAATLAFASQLVPGDPTSIARAASAAASVQAMGAVKVGLIAATGLAQAYQVTDGGGGSVGTGGYSSSGTNPPVTSPSDPSYSDRIEDDRRGVQIIFNGDVNGLDADQISRSIKDHLDSTDFVLVEPASRNGRALAGR